MSCRQNNSSNKDAHLVSQSRLSPQIRRESTDEGCPVIEESGTVCGETNSLNIFQEFRQMYDECLKKLEGTVNGNATLKRLAPFKKLIDDLWEQNTMLVETVEELEQEATYRVTNLQDRLNKSCQKICDYKDDIKSLVRIIHSFLENGVFDPTGLKFKTFCCTSVFGDSGNMCSPSGEKEEWELEASRNRSEYFRNTCPVNSRTQQEKIGIKCDTMGNPQVPRTFSMGGVPSSFRQSNPSKVSSIKCMPISCCENSIQNTPSMSNDQMCQYDNPSMPLNCAEYMGPISINFNIGNDGIIDSSDCCCECSCTINAELDDR